VDVEEAFGDGDRAADESKTTPPPNQLKVGRGTLVSVAWATRPNDGNYGQPVRPSMYSYLRFTKSLSSNLLSSYLHMF